MKGIQSDMSSEVLNECVNSVKVCDVTTGKDIIKIKAGSQMDVSQSVKSVSDFWNNRGSDYESVCGSTDAALSGIISSGEVLDSVNSEMAGKGETNQLRAGVEKTAGTDEVRYEGRNETDGTRTERGTEK